MPTPYSWPLSTVSGSPPPVPGATLLPASAGGNAIDILRAHLNPAIRGDATDALIEALASGDQANMDAAAQAFDQLFLSSASGLCLSRRAAEDGVERPLNVGIGDALFRDLATLLRSERVTEYAVNRLLEVFYGQASTHGGTETGNAEPYVLADGQELWVSVDGHHEAVVTLASTDFANISQARADEVAAAMNRDFRDQGIPAVAASWLDASTGAVRLRIYSVALGLQSQVQVTGGEAQQGLRFPTVLVDAEVGKTWVVSIPRPGIARYLTSGATTVDLGTVRVGDYVNVFGDNFLAENQGSWPVVAVRVEYVAAVLTQYLEVENPACIAQGAVVALTTADLSVYRPTIWTPLNSSLQPALALQPQPGVQKIFLPATSQVVERGIGTGGYLQVQPDAVTPTMVRRRADSGQARFVTAAAHGLSAGDWIWVDDLVALGTQPGVEAGVPDVSGNPGTTDASLSTIWSTLRDTDIDGVVGHEAVLLADGDVLMAGGVQQDAGPVYQGEQIASQLFTITATATVAAEPAKYATQYTYNWLAAGNLGTARQLFTATLLDDATVLAAGGVQDSTSTYLAGCELYNPGPKTWAGAGVLTLGRSGHTATLLQDGRVLVTGGAWISGTATETCEIYDPALGTWAAAANMGLPRCDHQATLLTNGTVLVTGGRTLGRGHSLDAFTLALWRFDEVGAGANVADETGTYDLTPTGLPPGGSAGKVGYCRDLIAGTYFTEAIPAAGAAAAALQGDWTLEFWTTEAATTPAGTATVIFYGEATEAEADNAQLACWFTAANAFVWKWEEGAGTNVGDSSAALVGATRPGWNHFALTKASTGGGNYEVTLYVNGVLFQTWAGVTPNATGGTNATWYVGYNPEAATDYGYPLDDLRVSTRALSATDVLRDWIRGKGTHAGALDVNGIEDFGELTASCELYDPGLDTWTPVGDMTRARGWHQATWTDGDFVVVSGGQAYPTSLLDYDPVNSFTSPANPDSRLEIWDPHTQAWGPLGQMAVSRTGHRAVYDASTGKVIIVGGTTSLLTEYLDVQTRRLTLAPASTETGVARIGSRAVLVNTSPRDSVLLTGGLATGLVTSKKAQLLVQDSDLWSAGGLNGPQRVHDVVSATEFQVRTPQQLAFTDGGTTASYRVMAAQDGVTGLPGAFIADPLEGLAITGTATTTAMDLSAGQQDRLLIVADATAFPDADGYLVLGFGTSVQTLPVHYLARVGTTQLLLDYGHRWTEDLPSGTMVRLLTGRQAWEPAEDNRVGMLYLTDSPAGRRACQDLLPEVLASGLPQVDTLVVYPGDRGLGAEGQPTTGATRLSDIVAVHGGSADLDAELQAAREA